MADYYYEISPVAIKLWGGQKYYVAHVRDVHDATIAGGFSLTMNSGRIWRQDTDGNIKFVKHRYENIKTAKVDLKEFMWIKLKAKEIK